MMSLMTRFGKMPRLPGLADAPGALLAETILEAAPDRFEMRLAMFAEGRHPMRDRPAPRALILDHRVAVAEIDGLLMRRRGNVARSHVDSDIAKEAEVALMRRQAVIAVVAVLDQQFPVGARAVGLLPGDDFHSDFGLIGHQVEVLPRSGQVVVEAFGGRVVAGKDKPAIAVHLRGSGQRALIARKFSAVGIFAGDAGEAAARVEGPGVIWTLKGLRVAGLLPADQCAAMRARVEQHADHAVIAAHQDDRTPGAGARLVIARVRHFGFVTDVDPAFFENPPLLPLKALGIGKYPAIDAEQSRFLVVDDVGFGRLFHGSSPWRAQACLRDGSHAQYWAIAPASTRKSMPVIISASSDARKTAALA